MSCLQTTGRGEPCDFCGKKDTPFRCPRCKSALYCSREHLKLDWKLHKRKCSGFTETGNQPAVTDRICLRDNGFIGFGANPYSSDPYHVNRTMQESQTELADFVVNSLYLTGHCIVDHFNGNSLAVDILKEMKTLHKVGSLEDGQLASGSKNVENEAPEQKIRGDKIAWVNSKDARCQATSRHVSAVDALIYLCNELIPDYEVRNRTKAMVACYPGDGTAYKRHVDNYDKDGRCITTLYYLNKGWRSEVNGGLLRLYPEGSEPVDIEPILDRLLIFWSDRRNPHEVFPTHSTRYAITLWYFDTVERERYINKQRIAMMAKALQQQTESQRSSAGKSS